MEKELDMDRKEKELGQSLLEIAIILPILLLLLLGVVEVGMGLRNYLIVVNANREAARFAAHGRYTDEDTFQILLDSGGIGRQAGYTVPFLRANLTPNPASPGDLISIDQVPPNTGIIITHVVFPADYEHTPADRQDVIDSAQYVVTGVITIRSGEVVSPELQIVGRTDMRWLDPDGSDSRADLVAIVERHGQASVDINQARIDAGLGTMDNHVIIIETYYMHYPLGEGLLPSPWIMYAQMEVRDASG